MLIGRCAWHPSYRGYPLLSGITSWRGWGVRFTDGICATCLVRFRAEHQRYLQKRSRAEVATEHASIGTDRSGVKPAQNPRALMHSR